MKAEDLRQMALAELAEKLEDLRKELFNLRFRLTTGELDNVMRVRQVRKGIARVLTIMRQKELAGETYEPVVVATKGRGRGRAAKAAKQ